MPTVALTVEIYVSDSELEKIMGDMRDLYDGGSGKHISFYEMYAAKLITEKQDLYVHQLIHKNLDRDNSSFHMDIDVKQGGGGFNAIRRIPNVKF